MSPTALPIVSGKQAVPALLRLAFRIDRIHGSHDVPLHDGPPVRAVSVPVHGSKPLPRDTLHDIIKKSGLPVAEIISNL